MTEPERQRPETARELFELHPETSVMRDRLGGVQGWRTVGRTTLQVHMMLMGAAPGQMTRSLRLMGYEESRRDDPTLVIVPGERGGLERKSVERQGAIEADTVLDTARQMVELLDGYVGLSHEEQQEYRLLPGANAKISDQMRPLSDTQAALGSNSVAMLVAEGEFDVLSVAQPVFL